MENKKNKTKIDIILPNYNSSRFILETVKSILSQTYKNWKLIIVDDCSNKETVNTLKKIKKNNKIKIFWLKKNHGAGFCRNYAIKKSYSPYVAFIDSDDLWKKDKLKKLNLHYRVKTNCLNAAVHLRFHLVQQMILKPKVRWKLQYHSILHPDVCRQVLFQTLLLLF